MSIFLPISKLISFLILFFLTLFIEILDDALDLRSLILRQQRGRHRHRALRFGHLKLLSSFSLSIFLVFLFFFFCCFESVNQSRFISLQKTAEFSSNSYDFNVFKIKQIKFSLKQFFVVWLSHIIQYFVLKSLYPWDWFQWQYFKVISAFFASRKRQNCGTGAENFGQP